MIKRITKKHKEFLRKNYPKLLEHYLFMQYNRTQQFLKNEHWCCSIIYKQTRNEILQILNDKENIPFKKTS